METIPNTKTITRKYTGEYPDDCRLQMESEYPIGHNASTPKVKSILFIDRSHAKNNQLTLVLPDRSGEYQKVAIEGGEEIRNTIEHLEEFFMEVKKLLLLYK